MNRLKRLNNKENLFGYAMIFPAMFFFCIFLLFPIFKAMQISLYDYSGIGKMNDFVGLANYVKSFSDETFFLSIINTLKIMFFNIAVSLPIAFTLAYFLYKNIAGWRFFSVTLFIPHIIPIIVAALVWRFMYETNFGLINTMLRGIGLESLAKNWLGSYETALGASIVAMVWKSIPFPMLVFYGAMLRIPTNLFEAANIDGANGWQSFRHIMIPLMAPVTSILVTLKIAESFRSFGLMWVLTQGGPGNSSTIATIHVFKQAFVVNQYGYANALAVEVLIIVGGIVTLLMTLAKRNENKPAKRRRRL